MRPFLIIFFIINYLFQSSNCELCLAVNINICITIYHIHIIDQSWALSMHILTYWRWKYLNIVIVIVDIHLVHSVTEHYYYFRQLNLIVLHHSNSFVRWIFECCLCWGPFFSFTSNECSLFMSTSYKILWFNYVYRIPNTEWALFTFTASFFGTYL